VNTELTETEKAIKTLSEMKYSRQCTQEGDFYDYEAIDELERIEIDALDLALAALRNQQERENPKPCPLCQRQDDYQLFCRGQEMQMDYCAFCGHELDHQPTV
jgi:hypothetical protein